MSGSQTVIVIEEENDDPISSRLSTAFTIDKTKKHSTPSDIINDSSAQLLVIHITDNQSQALDFCKEIKKSDLLETIPVIFIAERDDLQDRIKAFESGCDDYVLSSIANEELIARLQHATFHKIANDQLKSRIQQANDMAFMAMSDTSDLGANIRFLISTTECDNLDQLGQLFFNTVQHYDLHCSLQMRSEFGIKNMEANGLAKELESQLLTQLKDAGRYYDFGKRSIVNYHKVSVLVKNMPVDESVRYGTIKDNMFSLVQGLNSRVVAIDNKDALETELKFMEDISQRMECSMQDIDNSYQEVMRRIANVVEEMAEQVDDAIMFLALSEEQEVTLNKIVEECVIKTNKVFNEGLRIDENFRHLISELHNLFKNRKGDFSINDLNMIMQKISN